VLSLLEMQKFVKKTDAFAVLNIMQRRNSML